MIICPNCLKKLYRSEKQFSCQNKHCFDIAKEGYVNLNIKNSSIKTGDEKVMVQARTDFLNKGYYHFLREQLNTIITNQNTKTLVDLGCGEGYYTSYFDVPNKVGIDLSKSALKHAAKNDKISTYILSSIFSLPIEDKSCDTVLTCFAPISEKEIGRILKDNGLFILVRPNEEHLIELKNILYDEVYLNDSANIDILGFKQINKIEIKNKAILNNDDIQNLFMMTPYYHKTSFKDKEKLKDLTNLEITFSFIIDIYQKI